VPGIPPDTAVRHLRFQQLLGEAGIIHVNSVGRSPMYTRKQCTQNTAHLYRAFLSTMHQAHLRATFHRNVLKQHPEGVNGAVVTDDDHAHPGRAVGERLEEMLLPWSMQAHDECSLQ